MNFEHKKHKEKYIKRHHDFQNNTKNEQKLEGSQFLISNLTTKARVLKNGVVLA